MIDKLLNFLCKIPERGVFIVSLTVFVRVAMRLQKKGLSNE